MDGLGVYFIGALTGDHVDHFFHDIDIGAFKIALRKGPGPVFARNDTGRRAGGCCFLIQIAAHTFETRGIGESSQRDCADLGWCSVVVKGHLHRTVFADGNGGGILRDNDLRLQRVTVGGYQAAAPVFLERSRPRVCRFACGQCDFKKTGSLDCQVQFVSGVLKVADCKYFLYRSGPAAETNLNAGGG